MRKILTGICAAALACILTVFGGLSPANAQTTVDLTTLETTLDLTLLDLTTLDLTIVDLTILDLTLLDGGTTGGPAPTGPPADVGTLGAAQAVTGFPSFTG